MADEVDLAFEAQERHLSMAIAAQRRAGGRQLKPMGSCHWCGNDQDLGVRLFCDADCSRDWEREDSLRRKQGLPSLAMLAQGAAEGAAAAAVA